MAERAGESVETQLRRELALGLQADDEAGIEQRRARLVELFRAVPPAEARALHERLRPGSGDDLGKLFRARLATPTRAYLLTQLRTGDQQAAPAVAPVPKPSCLDPAAAEATETAAAEASRTKSRAVAQGMTSNKRSDIGYWFAQLYYYITDREIRDRAVFKHPAFVMHFIPMFYDMYAVNAEHFQRGEIDRIANQWQEHFGVASRLVEWSQTWPWAMAVLDSITTGVQAHIQGDMAVALAQAYRSYRAKYCNVPAFQDFREDFFERNKPVFEKVRTAWVWELTSRVFPPMLAPPDPDFLNRVGDRFDIGLSIETVYSWRAVAWDKAVKDLAAKP